MNGRRLLYNENAGDNIDILHFTNQFRRVLSVPTGLD